MSGHKSKLLVDRKLWLRDKDNNLLGIIQIKIWLVDDFRYPDKIKYRLVFAKKIGENKFDGDFLRYDNKKWKGPHIHRQGKEFPYRYQNIEKLIADFVDEIKALTSIDILKNL